MGNNTSIIKKVNFEDLQNSSNIILINTLSNSSEAQRCIIPNTIPCSEEESIINKMLNTNVNQTIVIYGLNTNDISVYKKYSQLVELGFSSVYVYPGGMFEWLLLQDIYGDEQFKTTTKDLDILKFRPKSDFKKSY